MNKNVVICGAWPYANNSLHLGHLAGLISGDLLARYHRLIGDNVLYVSGTDCHGTPITERAKKEKIAPQEICDKYHNEFVETFNQMGFSYDLYTRTSTDYHKQEVGKIFKQIYNNGYIYEKLEPGAFCEKCNKFLSDREIEFACPKCKAVSKADQCEGCGYVPEVADLKNGKCFACGEKTIEKENKNLYFALSKLQPDIEKYFNENKDAWRINSKNETDKYLKQGLHDRAVTRDLDWGVDVGIPGYENKKLYVWIEAVLGYITTSRKWCEDNDKNWEEYWKEGYNNLIYTIHGKDNIVFHSIIFNALMLGTKDGYHLVDNVVSTEYLNINDEKISKSKGNGITALDALEVYNPDSLRYHIISNGPEKKDSNFSVKDFEMTHNSEILNKFGNLVNRTLKFKELEEIPAGTMDAEMEEEIKKTYFTVSSLIESLEIKEAVSKIMGLVEKANKYYDEQKPWIQKKEDINGFNNTIYTCANIIANLSNLFEPIMPFACEKIRKYLEIENPSWKYIIIDNGLKLENIEGLFVRI